MTCYPQADMSLILQKLLPPTIQFAKSYWKVTSLCRTLTTSKILANYEGDGKTTITSLNREHKYLIMVDSFSNHGFRLNNGVFVVGPMAVFPRSILQWNISNIQELTIESLALFHLLEPKIDILVIGTGECKVSPSKDILQFLKSKKIYPEVLPTPEACSAFNFLNAEGRCIAGALLPPLHVDIYTEEIKILKDLEAMDDYTTCRFDQDRQKFPKGS